MKPKYLVYLVGVLTIAAGAYVTVNNRESAKSEQKQELPGATLGVRLATKKRGQVLIRKVSSDATKMGLKVGDKVLEVDGVAIHSEAEFIDTVARRKSGERFRLAVERDRSRVGLTRRYSGPIGVTKLELAASLGLSTGPEDHHIVPTAHALKQPRKREIQSASVSQAKKAQPNSSFTTHGFARKSKAGPPQTAPTFVAPADWIEL